MQSRVSGAERPVGVPPASGLLAGIRVLEIGHFVAAPFCARVLGDMGADVIKVEPPGAGDPVRGWGDTHQGHSPWWSVHGRNKHCVTLNLRQERGRAVLRQLVGKCDILIENFRPGQLEKWDLAPAKLARLRPGIVVVRISGYGQSGPDAGKSGFGVIGEAKGGLRYLTAHPPAMSDLPSVRPGISIGDSIAGLYGAIGALSAVIEQRATGSPEPRVIDVALGEAVLSLLEGCLPEYGLLGKVRHPMGSRISTAAPTNAYPCRDGGWLLIAGNSDPLFEALCGVIGRPELARDPRFLDNRSRVAHVEALDTAIGAWTGTLPVEEALARVEAANIPATKIYTIADCAADAQYRARGMVTEVADPLLGRVLHPGVVPMIEGRDRDAAIRWPGPRIGQHNDEIYGGLLALSRPHIEDMKRSGII